MAYALNINRGTEIVHPDIGLLEAGVARLIPDDLINIAKHLRGVIVFDRVAGLNDNQENKISNSLYGKDIKELRKKLDLQEEPLTYIDFKKKYKNNDLVSKKWSEYKKKHGLS